MHSVPTKELVREVAKLAPWHIITKLSSPCKVANMVCGNKEIDKNIKHRHTDNNVITVEFGTKSSVRRLF